jgi:hypothetical protein
MNLRYSQIAHATAFSNDRMVNLIKQKIAESENAAVALVFDDKLIVLDESNDTFHTVDYKIENKALQLSNWEKIDLVPDNETRLETVSEEFFDPYNKKEITTKDLVEAFRLKFADEPVRRLLNQTAVAKKRMVESNEKIKALREVRNAREYFTDDIADILNDPKIKSLASKIAENAPIQGSITRVDFKSPISVALFEEASDKVINMTVMKECKKRSGNIKKKVKNMWTSESFKKDLKDLIEEVAKSDDTKAALDKFVKQHVEVLILAENELEDLVLKTALMIGEAAKSDSLVELFKEYYSLDEAKVLRDDFISRNNIVEAEATEDSKDEEPVAEKEPKTEKSGETSIDEDSINKILKVLNKISENLKEKTMESRYVKSFVAALEDAKVGSISEGKLKEVLDFLTSVYDEAKNEKEEDSAEEA